MYICAFYIKNNKVFCPHGGNIVPPPPLRRCTIDQRIREPGMLNIWTYMLSLPVGFLKRDVCRNDKAKWLLPQTPIHPLPSPGNMGWTIGKPLA